MTLSIMEKLTEITDNFKDWLIENGSNPIFWIAIFLGGILIFSLTYNYLGKGKS